MKSKIEMDIVVITSGRFDHFDKCIDHIIPQLDQARNLIIINNGTNNIPAYNNTYHKVPNATIKRQSVNLGFSGGANLGIRAGSAPLIMFVTDDVFLAPDAIDILEERMNSDPEIGICGMKLTFPEDSTDPTRPAGKVQHIGMASNIRGDMIHPLIGWSPDNPKCNVSREVLAVTGAAFMMQRSVFRATGGFDIAYGRGYYEDMDLCFACRAKAGKRVYVDVKALGVHGVAQSFSKITEKSQQPNFQQNQALFLSRWKDQMPWSEFTAW